MAHIGDLLKEEREKGQKRGQRRGQRLVPGFKNGGGEKKERGERREKERERGNTVNEQRRCS